MKEKKSNNNKKENWIKKIQKNLLDLQLAKA